MVRSRRGLLASGINYPVRACEGLDPPPCPASPARAVPYPGGGLAQAALESDDRPHPLRWLAPAGPVGALAGDVGLSLPGATGLAAARMAADHPARMAPASERSEGTGLGWGRGAGEPGDGASMEWAGLLSARLVSM